MFPVYCTVCRAHIPKALSTANGGPCDVCLIAQQQAAATAAANAQAAAAAMLAAQQKQIFNTNTGKGHCPRCNSTNLVDEIKNEKNSARANTQGAGCLLVLLSIPFMCIGGLIVTFIGMAVLVVGFCLPSSTSVGAVRHCQSCGNQWAV